MFATIIMAIVGIPLAHFCHMQLQKCSSGTTMNDLLIYDFFSFWVFYIDRMNCDFFHRPMSFYIILIFNYEKKQKRIQRSRIEAIKTQSQPSKPKREITNIEIVKTQREHMVNRVSSYFPKGGRSATETELKLI